MNDEIVTAPGKPRRYSRWIAAAIVTALIVALGIGALPVSWSRGTIEERLSAEFDAPVRIGAITREPWFSYAPTISVRDARIAQPDWAGRGDFLRVGSAQIRVPVLALLMGRFRPDAIRVDGLQLALVRGKDGRSNWDRTPNSDSSAHESRPSLANVVITGGRFSLRDEKRGLSVAGPMQIDPRSGLTLVGSGSFLGTSARLVVRGGAIVGIDPQSPYPFSLSLVSSALRLSAKGSMSGTLNAKKFDVRMHAQAPTLKNLDRIIEAGLFGSQPIDFRAKVRHSAPDWFIDRIDGSIGRSRFAGRASVLKRDGRTAIDATMRASQFDFDDLADRAGLAEAAALKARIGARVVPATRINLSKIGKTDGTIRFAADRLLFKGDSVFRSLSGVLRLDHRHLTVSAINAGLAQGRITGVARVDHREGAPKLSLDLRFTGATLDAILGSSANVSGPVRGRIRLTGSGDTVREALARGNGRVAMVATGGRIKATIAAVLGQDLGKVIEQQIEAKDAMVPLRCLVANFRAERGILVPDPLAIDSGLSVGRGTGRIVMDGEAVELTMRGAARDSTILRIVDPIRVGGTLSAPSISVAGLGTAEKPKSNAILKVLGRSIKSAIGIGPKVAAAPAPADIGCPNLVAQALR